jgi:cytochrome c6
MIKRITSLLFAVVVAATASVVSAATSGEDLFKLHCAACHADGGNIINPKKTLKKADREANGVKTAKDIIGLMRKPGPGMTTFDAKTIPEKDVKAIADYILKTFK